MSVNAISRTMGPAEWTMLIVLSILWGGSFFFQAIAITELPTLTIVASRVLLASLTLFVVLRFLGTEIPTDMRIWAAFFTMGLLNNVIPFTLIVWGQSHIASGLASILNATTPLFAVIIAHFLTRDEKAGLAKITGVAIGFVGVAIMIGADLLNEIGDDVFAQFAILLAACTYGFAGVYGRRFKEMGVTPITTAFGQVTGSTLLLVPLAFMVDRPWLLGIPSMGTVLSLLALAMFSTALAYILVFRILASSGATNVLLVTFLIPVSAILLGVTILGEVLEARHFVGMALIGLGLATIDGRPTSAVCSRLLSRSRG
ncbi:MAG: DMT family transporter [Pseudomonadota bacterium]